MPARKIELELEQLNALRSGPPSEAKVLALRKALREPVNLLAAKAATMAAEAGLRELVPDLEGAFDRFFKNASRTDPQCWAKNAISKALKDLDYIESPLFLRGLHHVQMEPVYGGHADSAAVLRSTCALALVQCRDISRQEIMQHLVSALTDRAATVRADAARALEAMDGPDAALLLRLKASVGDEEPAVTGQTLDSLLSVEGDKAIPFVAGFLESGDEDVQAQAALSLGVSKRAGTVDVLKAAYAKSRDRRSAEPLLRAISVSRQESGLEFLLGIIRNGSEREARDAVRALELNRDSPEIARRIGEAVNARGEELTCYDD